MKIEKKIPDFFPFWFFLSCSVKKETKTLLKDMEIKRENPGLTGEIPQGKWKKWRESEEDEVLNHQEPFISVDLLFLSLIQTPKPG